MSRRTLPNRRACEVRDIEFAGKRFALGVGRVLDPACGGGNIVKAAIAAGVDAIGEAVGAIREAIQGKTLEGEK